MLTVVIPTLQRAYPLDQLLSIYCSLDFVSEVIIIDNAGGAVSDKERVTIIAPGCNVYVNPAWNMGVALAKTRYVLLANDDVLATPHELSKLYALGVQGLQAYGLMGQAAANYTVPEAVGFTPFNRFSRHGFGCMLMFERKRYIPVPEEFKVWRGDLWLALKLAPAGVMHGVKLTTQMSATSGSPEFEQVKQADLRHWASLHLDRLWV